MLDLRMNINDIKWFSIKYGCIQKALKNNYSKRELDWRIRWLYKKDIYKKDSLLIIYTFRIIMKMKKILGRIKRKLISDNELNISTFLSKQVKDTEVKKE